MKAANFSTINHVFYKLSVNKKVLSTRLGDLSLILRTNM